MFAFDSYSQSKRSLERSSSENFLTASRVTLAVAARKDSTVYSGSKVARREK